MPRIRLTAPGIASLDSESKQTDYWDELTPGLCVRVSGVTDRKTWYVRYRAAGKHRRMKLGTYPALGLADARKAARDVQAKADLGEDPALVQAERRNADHTFGALAREVLQAKARITRPNTQRERERLLQSELSDWFERPASSISRREVVLRVEEIAVRAPIIGNRTLALIKTIFNAGLKRGFPMLDSNPAHLVEAPSKETGRRRFLSSEEIRIVWEATESEQIHMRTIIRMTLLTAQRVGSVCALRWRDIDSSDVWTIPAHVFKGKREHAVPLSRPVLEMLAELPKAHEFAFPGRADGAHPHVSSTNNALQRVRARAGLSKWTLHDFRRTFRTHATRSAAPKNPKDPRGLGLLPHVADAVLGHKEASLGYDKYTGEPERYLLSEKRMALDAWAEFVMEIVG